MNVKLMGYAGNANLAIRVGSYALLAIERATLK